MHVRNGCYRGNYDKITVMSNNRDPFPYPRLENDADFTHAKGAHDKDAFKPIPGVEDPWNRLNNVHTLNSLRRHVYHYDPQAPNDDLDFVLKCQYNHSQDILKSKAETLLQPETVGLPHGRTLKNRPVVVEPVTLEQQELVKYNHPRKTTVDSAKGLAIESHHSEATNRGYSRKTGGGFYST